MDIDLVFKSMKQPSGLCRVLHGSHHTLHVFAQGSSRCENNKQNKGAQFGVWEEFIHLTEKRK
jgi:hypothetical protein